MKSKNQKKKIPLGVPNTKGSLLLLCFGAIVAVSVLIFVPVSFAAESSEPVNGSVIRLEQLPSSALPTSAVQANVAQNASQDVLVASADDGRSLWDAFKAKAANAFEATSTKVKTITDAQSEISRLESRIKQLEGEIVATHSQYRLANAQAGKASEAIETLCAAYHAGGLKLMLDGRQHVSR